jgi:hypothetical protein
MRLLMRVRSAGRLTLDADRRILDTMVTIGFTVLDRTPEELVVGAVARPWRTGRRPPAVRSAAAFVAYHEPGWAKIAFNFRAADGRLTTETRVLLTDDRARRAFGRYWLVIRPFSGLIRRRWLAAVDRQARSSRTYVRE